MSLIINMLKDLENSKKNSRKLPDIKLKSREYKRQIFSLFEFQIHYSSAIIFSFIAILTMAACIAVVIYQNKKYMHVMPFINTLSTRTTLNDLQNKPAISNTDVLSITIQPNASSTVIHFNINNPILYRLAKKNNHLYITFENANLLSTTPDFTMQDSLVESIHTRKLSSNLEFDLTLKNGWKIDSAAIAKKNDRYDFTISFSSTKSTKPVNSPVQAEIKKPIIGNTISLRYQQALAAAQAGRKKDAIEQLSALLLENNSHHQSRTALIALLIETGKYEQAENVLINGIKLDSNYVPYIELNARLHVIRNDYNGAISLLQQSAPEINEYPDYYGFLAALYEHSNRDSLAASLYKQLVQIEPRNGNWWFGLALSMDKVGNRKEAIYAYSTAMSKGNLTTASLNYLQKRLKVLNEAGNEAN